MLRIYYDLYKKRISTEPNSKRCRLDEPSFAQASTNGVDHSDVDLSSDGYKYIEKFNRDMMEQFMDFQRRSQSSFIR
jgi:hypothetical protein